MAGGVASSSSSSPPSPSSTSPCPPATLSRDGASDGRAHSMVSRNNRSCGVTKHNPSFTTPSHLQLFTKVAETDYATELAKIEAEAKKRLDEKVKELKEKMDKP